MARSGRSSLACCGRRPRRGRCGWTPSRGGEARLLVLCYAVSSGFRLLVPCVHAMRAWPCMATPLAAKAEAGTPEAEAGTPPYHYACMQCMLVLLLCYRLYRVEAHVHCSCHSFVPGHGKKLSCVRVPGWHHTPYDPYAVRHTPPVVWRMVQPWRVPHACSESLLPLSLSLTHTHTHTHTHAGT
jgi:hypothetical protein